MVKRLARWTFSAPEKPDLLRVIWWWEIRRIPFNLVIGTYGLICYVLFTGAISASGHLEPGEDAVEPLLVLSAPIAVNVLYTLGWLVELPLRIIWPGLPGRFGPSLLKAGLGLGMFLCSVPVVFWLQYALFGSR